MELLEKNHLCLNHRFARELRPVSTEALCMGSHPSSTAGAGSESPVQHRLGLQYRFFSCVVQSKDTLGPESER